VQRLSYELHLPSGPKSGHNEAHEILTKLKNWKRLFEGI